MDKSVITENIVMLSGGGALPPMSPDLIDDFVTYLYRRVDLYSFERSAIDTKLRYFRAFLKSLPLNKLKKAYTQMRQVEVKQPKKLR